MHQNRPMASVLIATGERATPPDLTGAPPGLDVRVAAGEDALEFFPDAEALIFWQNDPEFLRRNWSLLHRVRWVHVTSAGVEKILFPALRDSEVVLTNSQGVFDRSIAEHILAETLAHLQKVRLAWNNQRQRVWQKYETEIIGGRHAVNYGTGAIGRETARLFRAVGFEVSGVGRTARSDDPDFGPVWAYTELAEAASVADVLAICCPLTEETRGSVDASVLSRIKEGALVINTARGPVIVSDDLIAALDSGRVSGASLDVFDIEPLPEDSPLWDHPKVAITPHIAGDDTQWKRRANEVMLEQLRRWERGEPLLNVVDKALGFVPSGR
jgi:phosphoglycerate dehydrogenase-like enzyme